MAQRLSMAANPTYLVARDSVKRPAQETSGGT